MLVWRIYDHRAAYTLKSGFDPLDGQGAALYPGRWNRLGVRLLYTSESPVLAMLELLTKLPPSTFGVRLATEIALPNNFILEDAGPGLLAKLYQAEPNDTQASGSVWAEETRSLVLRVPSAVLPINYNYLVNPLHPQAKEVRIVRQIEVSLDPRLKRHIRGQIKNRQ